jgi:uncharacterized phage protein (predicted DNA packaging)
MLTLEESKLYLRVDSDDEDVLITSLNQTAKEMVEDILRYELTEFDTIPQSINQSMLYIVSTLYESRQVGNANAIKMDELIETVRRMVEPHRKKVW